jgi:hypothetical protein
LTAVQAAFDAGQLRFAGALQALADPQRFADHLQPTRQTEWVVYAKRPFAGPAQVLDYVGRYTHRVAIANQRLIDLDDGHVRFRYTDYRAQHRPKTMTLEASEFIRRFLLHVLPTGFHRIRYYRLLGHRHRRAHLTQAAGRAPHVHRCGARDAGLPDLRLSCGPTAFTVFYGRSSCQDVLRSTVEVDVRAKG